MRTPLLLMLISVATLAEAQYTFPLKISGDGRYFVDQNNKPFFINGDAPWDLPAGLTYQDARYYIDNADSNGVTMIVWRLITKTFTTNAPRNAYNVAPFTGRIFQSALNEPYWKHVDSVVDYAASKNIVIWAFPDYLGYGGPGSNQGFYDETAAASPSQMAAYGRALGQRFANRKNVIWGMGGDCDPTAVATWIDSLAAGIRTYADFPMTSRDEPETWASGHLGGKPWFRFNGFYTYSSSLYTWARNAYNWIGTRRPFILQETAYENEHSSTPQTLRAQAWWAVLGGATAGQTFGNCPVWNFSQYTAVCGTLAWKSSSGLWAPGRRSMKWVNQILKYRNWFNLVPDTAQSVMTGGYGTFGQGDYVTTAYASDSTTIIAYLPSARSVVVNPARLKGPNIHVWWVDPGAGTVTDGGELSRTSRTYSQPGAGDWVMVVDASAMNYPPPGSAPGSVPSVPALVSPANGATGVAANATLTWTATAGATSYHVQVAANSSFNPTVVDQANITATSYALSGLAGGTLYYWRVNAANTAGTSAYSTAWSFTTAPSPTGLVAAYAMDEGSGTTVSDKSGNNLTGTIVGATWTGGKYGSALSFDGSGSYVDLGNPALLQGTGSMTWSAWVKAVATPPDDGQIMAKSDDQSGWQLKTSADTGPRTFGVRVTGSAGSRTQRYSTTAVSLNTWYYVAGVYDATAKTLNIYVNGVLDNGTLVGTVPSSQVSAAVNANIGRRTGGYYFNGVIDEVRIYNRALSQAEILTNMSSPIATLAAPPGLIAAGTQLGEGPLATSPVQVYPNPFNPSTVVRYQVPADDGGGGAVQVRLVVYDILGREVAVLVDGQKAPGIYEAIFDGSNFPSGVYICRLTVGTYMESMRMILMK